MSFVHRYTQIDLFRNSASSSVARDCSREQSSSEDKNLKSSRSTFEWADWRNCFREGLSKLSVRSGQGTWLYPYRIGKSPLFERGILRFICVYVSVLISLIPGILNASIEKHFRKIENKSGMHSMENIDFIYMINLDRRPDRYENTMRVLAPYGIYPYRFSAVNGWELPNEAIDDIGIRFEPWMEEGPICSVFRRENGKEYISYEIMKEVGVTYYCHSLARGAIGCAMSHASILQDAYDSGYETIWIMEDDILIASDPRELSSLVRELDYLAPDWDVLFTDKEVKGGNGEPVPCAVIRPRPNFQIQPLDYYTRRWQVGSNFIRIGMRFGSASMIIRRSGMKKILDFLKAYQVYFPYDIEYFLAPNIQLYQCSRDIVTNIPGGVSDNGSPSYIE